MISWIFTSITSIPHWSLEICLRSTSSFRNRWYPSYRTSVSFGQLVEMILQSSIVPFFQLTPSLILLDILLSPPEPNAKISLKFQIEIDPLSGVVAIVVVVCHKFFTISYHSPEQLSKMQLNLAQSLLGWSEFKFYQMKDHGPFQRVEITK